MLKVYKHEDYFIDEKTISTPEQDDIDILFYGVVFTWSVLLAYFLFGFPLIYRSI